MVKHECSTCIFYLKKTDVCTIGKAKECKNNNYCRWTIDHHHYTVRDDGTAEMIADLTEQANRLKDALEEKTELLKSMNSTLEKLIESSKSKRNANLTEQNCSNCYELCNGCATNWCPNWKGMESKQA